MLIEKEDNEYVLKLRFEEYYEAKQVLDMIEQNKIWNLQECNFCGRIFDTSAHKGSLCRHCTKFYEFVNEIKVKEKSYGKVLCRTDPVCGTDDG